MKIILSPAKKMNTDTDTLAHEGLPVFLDQTEEILKWLRARSREELQNLWGCNDKIAEQNYKRLKEMDLKKNLTPAIQDPDGIKKFNRLGYVYRDDLSGDREIVFERR